MSGLLFHHARDLPYVRHGVVRHSPLSGLLAAPDCSGGCERPNDPFHDALWMDAAYAWVAERVGFWPVFLAAGAGDEDRWMTGYQDQWRRAPAARGEEKPRASKVLFSWGAPPPGTVFMDFLAWHMVLNSVEVSPEDPHRPRLRPLPGFYERQIWKRSWRQSGWMRMARRNPAASRASLPSSTWRAPTRSGAATKPSASSSWISGSTRARCAQGACESLPGDRAASPAGLRRKYRLDRTVFEPRRPHNDRDAASNTRKTSRLSGRGRVPGGR